MSDTTQHYITELNDAKETVEQQNGN